MYAATVMTAKLTVKLPSSSGSIPRHVAVQLKCCQWWTSQSAMIVEDHQTLNLLVSLYDQSLCMKEACHSIFSQNSPPLSLLYIMLVFVSYVPPVAS